MGPHSDDNCNNYNHKQDFDEDNETFDRSTSLFNGPNYATCQYDVIVADDELFH